ncbi:endonuclease/exonuclease/phosphatase family protein [Streptomyces sp. NPDC051940]|uniref:endonuclease/exonuclease/phosphatase family protein n=1 Tax=Streptomyces sp. NPDC051940 TaxID=3155675 RepID=UPI003415B19B
MLRRVIRLIACLVSLLLPTAVLVPASHAAESDPVNLRVLSYNIHHGAGPDDVLDLRHVMKVVAGSRADVVALQEVDNHWSARSAFADQTRWLAKELGMHAVYGANLDLDPLEPGQERRQYGTAILSRYPIQEWSNTLLPRFGTHEQRGLLVADLSVEGVPVRVANTHLQHDDALERQAQAARIVELLGSGPERTFLTGDLNATPDAPEIGTLTDVFADTWAVAGAGDGYTYPVEAPHARIDYVLASPDAAVRDVRVLAADASDHLPYLAEVSVRR